ncbi:hypothetical protein [Streptomyces sp. NPDC002785]|uniref:hypothetical protein n=1 Tax=Streptomyces sp. NPDC002785 TaxID=3154543 RepID=UPI0033215AAE
MRAGGTRTNVLAAALTAAAIAGGVTASANFAPRTPAAADRARLSRLAQSYLQQRADLVTRTAARSPNAAEPPAAATTSMRTELRAEFAALVRQGRVYQHVDGGYIRAAVDVTVNDAAEEGGAVTLRVTEDTRLYYPFTSAQVADGAPECEEYSLPHTLTFVRGPSGSWLLASDEAELSGGPAPSTQVVASGTA